MGEQIMPHRWTHSGDEVLILKCVDSDGISYGGFKWPLEVGATVEAPDWNDRAECGGGLHGWPWGLAMGDGKDPDWSGKWIVFSAKPEEVIDLGGKCKAAVVRLFDCYATEKIIAEAELLPQEIAFGDYHYGRFGWVTDKLFRLPRPIPYKAAQGLCDVRPETLEEVRSQWREHRHA